MEKKRLAFLSKESAAAEFMVKMLDDIFEGEVVVKPFLVTDKIDTSIPIVLTSHTSYYNDAKLLFPNSQIINGEKILTGFNLERVMMLPAGKRVLVVNTPRVSALGTIDNLIELGMTHLEYIPFVPGDLCPLGVDTAISPGLIHYCPPEILTRIDIGFRIFSLDAFNKLFQALDLSSHYLDKVKGLFNLSLSLSNYKLVENLEKVELYNRERELIINQIPDAVLFASADKKIIFLNKEMEGAIGRSKSQLVGKSVSEVICPISTGKDLLYYLDEDISAKITLDGREYLYSCTAMQEGKNKYYIFTFKLLKKLKALERSGINYKKYGHVARYTLDDFWGDSEYIADMKKHALLFAKNDMTILIAGESGTGKEILAQSIHNISGRRNAPFWAVNFAAIPENLIESELFGYEGGAFTGARREGKPGYFEMADGGTIFIDEIGDMPMFLQSRLLRVLQEREIIRVGGSHIIPVDIRVIAATNADLKQLVDEGKFRKDLYFRLNVLSINTIPLRQFKDSIDSIIEKYLALKYNFAVRLGRGVSNTLRLYDWPGNIRELSNVADYMFHTSEGKNDIGINHIPQYIVQEINKNAAAAAEESCPARPADKDALGAAFFDFLQQKIKLPDEKERGEKFFARFAPDKLQENVARAAAEAEDNGKKALYSAILTVLLEKGQHTGGRNFIKKALHEHGVETTEHYLKIALAEMKKAGLIQAGSTRQGTNATDKGRLFLYNNQS